MKKNCLLILPRDIFPVIGGYSLKNEALIKGLSKQYNLILVVISERKPKKEEMAFYIDHSTECHYFYFPKWRFLNNAFLGLFSNKPIQANYFYFNKVQKCVDVLLTRVDIAIGALVRTMLYLENSPKSTFKLFDMVDSFGLIYQKSKQSVNSILWKTLYSIESDRLLKFEEKNIQTSNLTYLFSATEAKYWKGKSDNVIWIPYGIKDFISTYNKKEEGYENAIAFIGKMDYRPNIDAVKWYVQNIHEHFSDKYQFIIIGAYPTDEVKELASKYKNVTVTGFVEDPYIILNSVKAIVAPMQTGGGIQTKVLEAMSLGKVVILSNLAAAPINGTVNDKHFIIADTLNDYFDAFKKLEDDELCRIIGQNAKELVNSTFTWENYLHNYIKHIEDALNAES